MAFSSATAAEASGAGAMALSLGATAGVFVCVAATAESLERVLFVASLIVITTGSCSANGLSLKG